MESSDSSPHYMRATSSSDGKKENSPGGSECDDMISVSSSTGGSAINGPYAPKTKIGIKYRTNNKKTLINLGNVKSFRRRGKSRILQPIEMSDNTATSHHDSLVDASEASPHYLKSTSCSEGKKIYSQASPRHSITLSGSGDEISSHPSRSGNTYSGRRLPQALSRTSSIRNVRILLKRSSFKPKRTSPNYFQVSEDAAVDRATYSSTLKGSKFPEPVEVHPETTDCEKTSVMKVCRYHHCSLHGHCRENHDPIPPPKHFLYKRRRPLKKQKSVMSKTDQSSLGTKLSGNTKKNLQMSQMISIAESSVEETENDNLAFSGVKNEKGMDLLPFSAKPNGQPYTDGYGGIPEFDLVELAFGETSFPERSYQENVNIMRKYSQQEQEFGGTAFGLKGYCLKCSCNKKEEIASTLRSADVDVSECQVADSNLSTDNTNEISQNGDADVLATHPLSLFKNPEEQIRAYVEDGASFDRDGCKNKTSNKDCPETPVIFDEVTTKDLSEFTSVLDGHTSSDRDGYENETPNNDCPETPVIFDEVTKDLSEFTSVLDGQTSSDSNFELEGELTTESTAAGDTISSTIMEVKDSEINVSACEGNKLQFSKPRHISMWHLIHQHMASELATEAVNKPLEGAEGQNQLDNANSLPAKESSASCRDFSDTNMSAENDSETQEIELRKFFAIKLVREAIEKILLPEVQDDQSVTSENIPLQELTEKEQSEACTQESYGSPDADDGECNVPLNPEEIIPIVEDSSSSEMKKTEKMTAKRSEKKAPKHWSNLKKWILLQRFIRELEKVRKFNPRKPQLLPLNPDPEAEKVNLRPQAVDERKKGEEWMLDYALRQAVNQLAPTQKRKVALLVKAFETVVPSQEDQQIQYRIPRLNDNTGISLKVGEAVSGGNGKDKVEVAVNGKAKLSRNNKVSILDSANQESFPRLAKTNEKKPTEKSLVFLTAEPSKSEQINGEPSSATQTLISDNRGKSIATGKETSAEPDVKILQGDRSFDGKDANEALNAQLDRKNQIRMWHMIYQHVVSSIAEKLGTQLLEGSDDDESEDDKLPAMENSENIHDISKFYEDESKENNVLSNPRSWFSKTDALKLVKEAVNEILNPESQSDSSEFTADQEISEETQKEVVEPKMPKPKSWIKLKKLLLLKKSIKALEKARNLNAQTREVLARMPDMEPEKIDLRHQMMDERKRAELWMLDYAVQHIVTKLNPDRKRKVSMLVEAFEAVVPLPEM